MITYTKNGMKKAIQITHDPRYGLLYRKHNLSQQQIANYVFMQKIGVGVKVAVHFNSILMAEGVCLAYLIDMKLISKNMALWFEAAANQCYHIMKMVGIAHTDIKPQNIILVMNSSEFQKFLQVVNTFKQWYKEGEGNLTNPYQVLLKKQAKNLLGFQNWQLKLIDNDDVKKYGSIRQVYTPGFNGNQNSIGRLVDQNTDVMGWANTINLVKKTAQ